jgi:hypothetical protein
MNEFVFLYHTGDSLMTPQSVQEVLPKWAAWFQTLASEGHLGDRGHPLQHSGKRVGKLVTDGPFAEAKDVIGGYSLIKARDLAEATQLALGCPAIERGGQVEVRPVMNIDPQAA